MLGAGQKIGYQFDGLLRGRKANAWEALACQMVESLERERQVRAALVVGDRVDFVHDDGFDGAQDFATSRGGQQDVKRLRRGD